MKIVALTYSCIFSKALSSSDFNEKEYVPKSIGRDSSNRVSVPGSLFLNPPNLEYVICATGGEENVVFTAF